MALVENDVRKGCHSSKSAILDPPLFSEKVGKTGVKLFKNDAITQPPRTSVKVGIRLCQCSKGFAQRFVLKLRLWTTRK